MVTELTHQRVLMTFTSNTHTPKFIFAALLLALILLTRAPIGYHHSVQVSASNFTKQMGVYISTITRKVNEDFFGFGSYPYSTQTHELYPTWSMLFVGFSLILVSPHVYRAWG